VHPQGRAARIAAPAIPGVRVARDQPLTVEELWRGSREGPPHMDEVPEEDCCTLCLQLISHPVLYVHYSLTKACLITPP
jgi:hypothetical protein